jgi:hypothetical protein
VHHTIPACEDVAGHERAVLPDEEDDLLRLAVQVQRLDPRGQLVGVAGFAIFRQTARGGVQTDAP